MRRCEKPAARRVEGAGGEIGGGKPRDSKGHLEELDVKERWGRTGKEPVTFKWIDTDRGEGSKVKIRSRLVARDLRTIGDKDREDLFVATPPLELLRALLSKAATRTRDSERASEASVHRCKEGPPEPEVRAGRLLRAPSRGEPAAGKA